MVQQVLRGVLGAPSPRGLIALSLEEGGRGQSPNLGGAGAREASAFLDGGAVGVGRELRQAGLLGASVMGEDRVLAGGAGGAAGVRVTLVQGRGQLQVLLKARESHMTSGRRRCCCGGGGTQLTWLDVMARQRSRSSTSCLKVGLWEGTACQQSLIIMYLKQKRESAPGPKPDPEVGGGLQLVGAGGGFVHAVAFLQ